jgi:hypothetical protein
MTATSLQRRFAPIKGALPKAIWQPLRAFGTGIITPIRFSLRTGHWKSSITMTPCSSSGVPLPWYTYPAIDFLAQRNFMGKNVLELGAGQSTLWWSARADTVLSIEEDAGWYARLRSQVSDNVSIHHIPVDRATRTIVPIKNVIDGHQIHAFDIIVIDGHLREELTALAFEYLKPNGAIIFDDSEGYGFYDETKGRDCRRVDFFGFAPGVSLRRCTSIVFVGDCFLLKPDIPIPVIEFATT